MVSGVPQGSVLGHLLFLMYFDDVSNSVSHCKIAIYADDIAMYKIIRNPTNYTYLQEGIDCLTSWISNYFEVLLHPLLYRKHQPTLPASDLQVGGQHALASVSHCK